MTIAIGVLADNGLVMGADTQQTVPGFWKYQAGKIGMYTRLIPGRLANPDHPHTDFYPMSMAITGSGLSTFISGASSKVINKVEEMDDPHHLTFKPAVDDVVRQFFDEHVLPFNNMSDEYRPTVNLLVGVDYRNGPTSLYASSLNLVNESPVFVATGTGETLATTLLGRLVRLPLLNIVQTAILVSYVLFNVKESVDGCGGQSDIVMLNNGRFYSVPRAMTDHLDDLMRDYSFDIEPAALRKSIGAETPLAHGPATMAPRFQDVVVEMTRESSRVFSG